jgi:outer membrane protein assembly factor BamB
MNPICLVVLLAATAPATTLHRPGKGMAWGYQGDGSAVMNAQPPLRFDATKPVWKTPLPAYGLSTPIVVAGKVFVTCEPTGDMPWARLICLDAKDGKQLWVAELNHLPGTTLTAAQQSQAAKL